MARLCLTLAESEEERLKEKVRSYAGRVDLIEVRLDFLDPLREVPYLEPGPDTRLLATCRPSREGGRYEGGEEDRLRLLEQASRRGFHWIDLEHDVSRDPNLIEGCRILRSIHDFEGRNTLPELWNRVAAVSGQRDVVKVARMIKSTRELAELLDWIGSTSGKRIVIGMGSLGEMSRSLGGFLGNEWTYVAEGEAVAPGQFSFREAVEVYRLDRWAALPELYGVIGRPVGHSRSPLLHNALFQHYGKDALYLPVEIDEIAAWFGYLERSQLPFRGFSVTIPFKLDLDEVVAENQSDTAAINTLARQGEFWIGSNTDAVGFLRPLIKRGFEFSGASCVVLGNGGVAHTVVSALQERGVSVTVAGRNRKRVENFAARHGCRAVQLQDLQVKADLCVNTTPVGQFPGVEESPLADDQILFPVVYDLVYNPVKTLLLERAAGRGAETVSGIEMFIEQGAAQFELWTGIDPDRSVMRSILEGALP